MNGAERLAAADMRKLSVSNVYGVAAALAVREFVGAVRAHAAGPGGPMPEAVQRLGARADEECRRAWPKATRILRLRRREPRPTTVRTPRSIRRPRSSSTRRCRSARAPTTDGDDPPARPSTLPPFPTFSPEQLALYADAARVTVYSAVRRGSLPALRIGNPAMPRLRIPHAAAFAWIASRSCRIGGRP